MLSLSQIFFVFLSALTVIVGDSVVKKISTGMSFISVLKDPWMLLVYGLYLVQILLAVYIFMYKGDLVIYTNLYIVFYSVFGIISGYLFFKEGMDAVQIAGIVLAIIGGILINHG